ncbi:hypothetical protein [Gordonia sp. NPDC003585]|uniref:hypothetical protein n=1 Tax=Gordonia sp. NPDC003585 TaxID=3154275 RepID=UPI0033B30ECB
MIIAARLCATAVAVAAIAGGVTLGTAGDAAAADDCNLSGKGHGLGKNVSCSWETQGTNVKVTLGNGSNSRLRCDIAGSGSSTKTYYLRPSLVTTVDVPRNLSSPTRVDVACKSDTGQEQLVDKRGSFNARPPAGQTGGCLLSGTGSMIACSWKADATTINVTITNRTKSSIHCKIDGSESSEQNYKWKPRQSGYVGVKRDADRTTTVSIDCKNYSGEPEQVQKTGSFSVARAS